MERNIASIGNKRPMSIAPLTRSFSTTTTTMSHAYHDDDMQMLPGSPYRTTSSSLNQFTHSKPNLSKELLHKLRSMTETIKMLHAENAALKRENDELREVGEMAAVKHDHHNGLKTSSGHSCETYPKDELIAAAFDAREKELLLEIENLSRRLKDNEMKEASKDKYKSLARRLKEERNQYKETCERKLEEQQQLKKEMNNMSELINELRDQCEKLQAELENIQLNSRPITTPNHKGIQVSVESKKSAHSSSARRLSNSSMNESARKAVSVYNNKQPVPRKMSLTSNKSTQESLAEETKTKPSIKYPQKTSPTTSSNSSPKICPDSLNPDLPKAAFYTSPDYEKLDPDFTSPPPPPPPSQSVVGQLPQRSVMSPLLPMVNKKDDKISDFTDDKSDEAVLLIEEDGNIVLDTDSSNCTLEEDIIRIQSLLQAHFQRGEFIAKLEQSNQTHQIAVNEIQYLLQGHALRNLQIAKLKNTTL